MDSFNEFLEKVKTSLGSLNNYQGKIHVIMGNESCDLDSMISPLALGYLWYRRKPADTLVIPILSIPSADLCLRTENCYLLKKLGIDHSSLVFSDDLNLKELQNSKRLSISLVDHHMLSSDYKFLSMSVTEIFDHRPIDSNAAWDKNKVKIRIEQVGSCCTLIADEILNFQDQILTDNLTLLLHYGIIFDTIAFSPEAGRVKELDILVSKKLSERFPLDHDVKSVFDELWSAHNDVSHLTPKQLLSKDLKIVEGLPIPGLPMLVEDYLKLQDVLQDMTEFCKEKCSSVMVIIGLHVVECEGVNQVHRDVAVFNCGTNNEDLVNIIVTNLKNAPKLKGYDFDFEEISVSVSGIKCFKQNNIKLTRKHILPLLKDAYLKYKSN
ncbi:hypothetical protein ILUMI_11863, partial [Ignelater luminosus]